MFLIGLPMLLGLLHSAVVCLRRRPDADMATASLVYEAVRRHGLGALSTWHYTQDNWLLSVIVPELPVQALLGVHAWLPSLSGWLFFTGSCALVGLLARPSIGQVPALLLTATLLFANSESLTGVGFLAHPASHDITCFWSLLALLPAMVCLRGGSPVLLALSALALLIATISDPWARAAFLLPMTATAVVGLVLLSGHMRRASLGIGLSTLPAWAAGSHAFGFLPTLPTMHFERGPLSAVPAHLAAGLRGLGLLLAPLPVQDPQADTAAAISGLVGLLVLCGFCLVRWRGCPGALRSAEGFLILICLLSGLTTLLAFGLSALPLDPGFTRLVMNGYFVLPLLLSVGLLSRPWRRTGALAAAALSVGSACFMVSAVVVPWMPVREHSVGPVGWQDRLIRFLEVNDLHVGYGGYWGSDANASRLRSGGRVTIRPVEAAPEGSAPIGPGTSQTFDDWYAPDPVVTGNRTRFFVAVPDPGLCSDRRTCREKAIHTFGLPDRILTWEGYDILVWSHPILFHSAGATGPTRTPFATDGLP